MAKRNLPIIAHGEMYVDPISRRIGNGAPVSPVVYESAKTRMISTIDAVEQQIAQREEVFLAEKVVCVRMEPKFEAKSYVPTTVINNDGMKLIGGRKYRYTDDAGQEQKAKLYFVKTTDAGLTQLKDKLTSGSKDNVQAWRDQVTHIRSVDLLTPGEKIMGFDEKWNAGTVEVVLHPLAYENKEMIAAFLKLADLNESSVHISEYDGDIVFICGKLTRSQIEKAKRFNPLRAIHPLDDIRISELRTIDGSSLPQIPSASKHSSIRVGVFDGGANMNSMLLKGFVHSHDSISFPPRDDYLAHGSAVCCAVLFGDLVGKNKSDILPLPCVTVESFRVLPVQPSKAFTGDEERDFGLYDAIDAIESAVSQNPKIKLFNISFGPPCAIQDDSISRFTYSIDRMTFSVPEDEVNPLFAVAVGNEGALESPLNRIQAPSDSVNALAIGAYTYNQESEKVRSGYSCVGAGREGAKTKPDILEFGGSIDRPMVLLGADGSSLAATAGTSFASPLALGKIGKLMARSGEITPHIGRTLMIHNSTQSPSIAVEEQGFGFAPNDVEDILHCDSNAVTVLYSGKLMSSQSVKLPIFSPLINTAKGNVNIAWTVTAIVDPNINDPDAYTNNCLYDVFFPNNMIFYFNKKGKAPIMLDLSMPADVVRAREITNQGYIQAALPASHPAKKSFRENDLRANDFKWDTVIKKEATCRSSSLWAPFLTLQAIGRNGFEHSPIKYSVAITINAKKYPGSLYDIILQTYPQLAPIEIRNISRVMVEV